MTLSGLGCEVTMSATSNSLPKSLSMVAIRLSPGIDEVAFAIVPILDDALLGCGQRIYLSLEKETGSVETEVVIAVQGNHRIDRERAKSSVYLCHSRLYSLPSCFR